MKNRRRAEYLPISKPKYKAYHDEYDRLRMASVLMNKESRDHSLRTGSHVDITYLQSMLNELAGSDKGKYYNPNSNSWEDALIPTLKSEIEGFESDFERQKKIAANEGRELNEMSGKKFFKLLSMQARYDVFCEEADYLKEQIEKLKNVKEEIVKRNILQYGPRGAGKMLGGNLIVIDGQKVSSVKVEGEVVLIIDEPTSPYDGLAVVEYRKSIVHAFLVANQKLKTSKRAKATDDKNYPQTYQLNSQAPFPAVPEGAINYKEIKRTKH